MTLRVVITGASSGIGAALAREYARRGATLGLLARREQALQGLLRELACPIAVYPADVRDAAAVSAAARPVLFPPHRHSRIAGISSPYLQI